MEGARLKCDVVCYEVDESYPADLDPLEVPEYLARLKGSHYPQELVPGDVLITADTVVICEGVILGKPRDEQHAREMLRQIAGREHCVVTGVAMRSAEGDMSFSCQSTVRFAALSDEEIDFYVMQYSPLDKAGSYGIQEWIGYIGIEGIEGSFYNVMGLPIQRLYTELNKFIG